MSKFLSCTSMTGGYGGEDIIKNCNIEVDKGQISVIVGPNGAGKSTAMKAMLGMIALKVEASFLMAKIYQTIHHKKSCCRNCVCPTVDEYF